MVAGLWLKRAEVIFIVSNIFKRIPEVNKSMNVKYLDKGGVVSFNDFIINKTIPLEAQLDNLKEDMLQIEFSDGYLLDVGWRPSFSKNGEFKIVLIKDFNWDEPVYSGSAKNIIELETEIEIAIDNI